MGIRGDSLLSVTRSRFADVWTPTDGASGGQTAAREFGEEPLLHNRVWYATRVFVERSGWA